MAIPGPRRPAGGAPDRSAGPPSDGKAFAFGPRRGFRKIFEGIPRPRLLRAAAAVTLAVFAAAGCRKLNPFAGEKSAVDMKRKH